MILGTVIWPASNWGQMKTSHSLDTARSLLVRSGVSVLCAALAVSSANARQNADSKPTYVTFNVPGAVDTFAYGINSKGYVAGYYDDVQYGQQHGFLRHPDGAFETFDAKKSASTYVEGIDDDGRVAGYYWSDFRHGYMRHLSGRIEVFDPPGSTDTFAKAISDGYIAGYFHDAGGSYRGFLRAPGGVITIIDVPGSNFSEVVAYAHGLAIINGDSNNGPEFSTCFVYDTSKGTLTQLFPDENLGTLCASINADGVILGEYVDIDEVTHNFVFAPDGTFSSFDVNGATETHPAKITHNGTVAGTWLDSFSHHRGFVRNSNGKITKFVADKRNGFDTIAIDINKHNVITGWFTDNNNIGRGFLRVP
jgi:hypothetical protein